MDNKEFETVIKKTLISADFKKKGGAWYKIRNDALQVIDLQKSAYGDQRYINICFVPSGMNVEGLPNPRESKCPIRIRATTAFPKSATEIEDIFNLEKKDMSDQFRTTEIERIFNSFIFPFFLKIEAQGLKKSIENGDMHGAAISSSAKQYLGIENIQLAQH